MDINWAELLLIIQQWRAELEAFGITYETLMIVGALATALFLISLREVVVWYLRIGQLHEQMRVMHDQLIYIRKTLEEAKILIQMPADMRAPDKEKEEPVQKAPPKKFTLDH